MHRIVIDCDNGICAIISEIGVFQVAKEFMPECVTMITSCLNSSVTVYCYNGNCYDLRNASIDATIVDVYSYVRKTFGHDSKYAAWCKRHGHLTRSKGVSLTFENVYRYVRKENSYVQKHDALQDAQDLLTFVREMGI